MTSKHMLCVSANPAIDRRLRVNRLAIGSVNRAHSVKPMPGGKAAHVALAAHALGVNAQWIGFLGGATGADCESGLVSKGVSVVTVPTKAPTRENLEIIDQDGNVTEVLEPGGRIEAEELSQMESACQRFFQSHPGAVVVLSGSLPPGLAADFYASIIQVAHRTKCWVLLDTSGDAFIAALQSSPDLVKPNREEAEQALGHAIESLASAGDAVRWMVERGAQSAAVSLGAEGVVWLEGAHVPLLFARPAKVATLSTVGCGDTTVAGFAYAAMTGMKGEEALRFAVACGTANCLAETPGMISKRDVEKFLPQITVQSL